jgi:hypothetical protein
MRCISGNFLGPMLSQLTLTEYFSSGRAYRYITNALSMARTIQVVLPGVIFYDGRYGQVVNGSLWTIPLEVRLYAVALILAIIAKVLRIPISISHLLIIIGACIFDFSAIIPNEDNYRLSIFFFLEPLCLSLATILSCTGRLLYLWH